MQPVNQTTFIARSTDTLREIAALLNQQASVKVDELFEDRTALIIMDMVNGFANEGTLQSPRVNDLIPVITALATRCAQKGIPVLAFADCHSSASPEFESYPVHCLAGTRECDIVDEIKSVDGYILIPKNSTNGFLADMFQGWLKSNPQVDTFIVAGDCTDICIQQFAITLKTWFNNLDKKSRVIVPMDAVDTYDLGLHDADLMNVMALFNMMGNGVEVVTSII